jgi:hypothetical protein
MRAILRVSEALFSASEQIFLREIEEQTKELI